MTNEGGHENADHEELLQWIEKGAAAILSDDQDPGGRFQIAAVIRGGERRFEFVLTQWHQDAKGDWRSQQCLFLKGDAATRLLQLVHTAGVGAPLRPVP